MVDYSEKIAKVEEAIAKKQTLIEKRKKQIEKKVKEINKLIDGSGIAPITENTEAEVRRVHDACRMDRESDRLNEAYWACCSADDCFESIESAYRAIQEKQNTLATYQQRVENDNKRLEYLASMPACFTEFRDRMVADMDKHRIGCKKEYKEAQKKMSEIRSANFNRWIDGEITYSERDELNKKAHEDLKIPVYQDYFDHADEKIHLDNVKEATDFVIDTCHRVVAITGEITDTKGVFLTWGNQFRTVINGLIIGKEGKAEIETIECGGYNIVCWHLRTIVHDRS